MSTYAPCARHRDAVASFCCEGCGEVLCVDCVDEGRLVICRLCGERAHPLIDEPAVGSADPRIGGGSLLYEERSTTAEGFGEPERWRDDPATLLIHHGLVPLATISMITALLFYLVDVRSVFLAGTGSLKWLGLCFVSATVLIARYGKMQGGGERQGCYTFALLGATLAALAVAPWEKTAPGPLELVVNALILVAIWRFAGAVTRGLSLEGEQAQRRGRRLYGLERLAFEQATDGPRTSETKSPREQAARQAPPRPGRSVARLTALALVIFAVLEPLLLSGSTEVVRRGLGSMVVFLLSAGVVLATSSSVETWRLVRRGRGRAKVTAIPGRVLAAAALVLVLVAVTLATPGIATRGRGERMGSTATPGLWDRAGDRGPETDQSPDGGDLDGASERPGSRRGQAEGERSPTGEQVSAAGEGLLGLLTELGRWLRWPTILLAVVVVALAVVRLWPLLAARRRGWGKGWSRWWQELLERLRRRPRSPVAAEPPAGDPWADLAALAQAPPRSSVVEAYGRFLLALAVAGFEREERLAPYELLSAVARWRRALEPAARRLTDLYVVAAFGQGEVGADDREQALRALATLRRALPAPS